MSQKYREAICMAHAAWKIEMALLQNGSKYQSQGLLARWLIFSASQIRDRDFEVEPS